MTSDGDFGRRTFIKGVGGAAAGAGLTGGALGSTVDSNLDTEGGVQEAIVVFRSREDVDRLDDLALAEGYYEYRALPFGYAKLTGDQIRTVASWPEVEYVQGNHEIEFNNEDAREVTNAQAVQRSQYTGESVHVAVVDSGIDGDHPAFLDTLEHNFRFANPLETEMWEDVGPANTGGTGHGTHVSGSIAGEQTPVDRGQNDYGMAPDASLTVYSTTIGVGLVGVTGAYDDIIARQRRGEHDVQIINNSYSGGYSADYDPTGAHQRATWAAFQEGILSVFSAGNEGPDTNVMSDYAAGPHVMSSAATYDDARVADFSSRGRSPEYDGGRDGANYDRRTALEQVKAYYDAGFTGEDRELESGNRTGTLGAAGAGLAPGNVEDPDTPVTGSEFEEIPAPADATLVTISVGWDPDGDNDIYLRKGGQDGEVVASSTTFNGNPEVIRTEIEGGADYVLEIRPFLNARSQYNMNYAYYDVPDEDIPDRPYGLHRPAVGTPGNYVMSTLDPADPLQAYPTLTAVSPIGTIPDEDDRETIRNEQVESSEEPYYGLLSGTSMSAPVLSGLAALVYDAYRQNHLEWPDPMDVINTLEATAIQPWPEYEPHSIGAGFVDVKAAVKRAIDGDLATFDEVELVDDSVDEGAYVATASRTDDGQVFTAGGTNHVELDLTASTASDLRDRIPSGWNVIAGDHERVYTSGGERFVEFTDVPSDGTVSYLVEVPPATGRYEFGPAAARPADGGEWVIVTEAEYNHVGGVDQNSV